MRYARQQPAHRFCDVITTVISMPISRHLKSTTAHPPKRRTAMGTFRLAVDITSPPSEVFTFIAEPRNMPQWYEAVDHVTQTTAGPHGIGSMYDVTRSLPGGQVHNDVEITEHNPNRLVTLESRAGPTPFRYRYELQPNGQGTHLTLEAR